jgi:uncharacterized protein YjdB
VKVVAVCFVVTVMACTDLLLGQVRVQPLAKVSVTITPTKATLFAGETQTFVATVVGTDNQSVNWSVEEQDGGAITDMGHYTAPKLQGVYHITATSRARPEANSVATVTVLTYCDPVPASLRR